jgi:hypothetical protein
MDIAILILVIVAILLLGLLTFFIFQIWIQSKESKIQMVNHLQEIQKGFSNSENILRTLNVQLIEKISIENKIIGNSIDQFRLEIKELDKQLIEKISIENKIIGNSIDQFGIEIKVLDNNLSDKLVKDLTDLTNKYAKKLSDEQIKILNHFELAGKEINAKQGDILKAITEPLKINLKQND